MESSTKQILVKMEPNYSVSDYNTASVGVFVKTEPFVSTNLELDQCEINNENNIKTEINYESECIVKVDYSESNLKTEHTDRIKKELFDPLDVCTQLDTQKVENIPENYIAHEIFGPSNEENINGEHNQIEQSDSRQSQIPTKPFEPKKVIHICEICSKPFKQRSSLNVHKRSHSHIKSYTCHVCQKSFKRSEILKRHLLIHTDTKSYVCDVCSKEFRQKIALERHKVIHTGEKPYLCEICNKRFGDKSVYINHKRIHSGEKPYSCDLCDKVFARRDTLLTHKRTHTGEKPYTCGVCNMSFGHRKTFLKHKLKENHNTD